MSYQLKFEHPQLAEDTEVGFANLGTVVNGGTLEIDEDAERLFVIERGLSLEDAFKGNSVVTLTGSSSLSSSELQSLLPESEATVEEEEEPTSVLAELTHEGGEDDA